MNSILMESNSPTQQRTQSEAYSFPIHADYEEFITDIDDKNKRIKIIYDATQEGFAMTIHKLEVKLIDAFIMPDSEVIMSVFGALELTNPRTYYECAPTVKL